MAFNGGDYRPLGIGPGNGGRSASVRRELAPCGCWNLPGTKTPTCHVGQPSPKCKRKGPARKASEVEE